MIDRKVLLVLGAGASQPYGFPLGSQLRDWVLENGNEPELIQCLDTGFDVESHVLQRFVRSLRGSACGSVDEFLEGRRELMKVGKAVIAFRLIQCEKESHLNEPLRPGIWYQLLADMLLTDGFEGFAQNTLRIVTYNYDRSLELFLYEVLHHRFGRPRGECAEVLKQLPIIHVHGQLGPLTELTAKGRPYEPATDAQSVAVACDGIKIVSEAKDIDPAVQDALAWAEKVIFLGFGYLKANVERLKLDQPKSGQRDVDYHGTAIGVTESERQNNVMPLFPQAVTENNLALSYRPRIRLFDGTAYEFLRNHVELFKR